MGGLTAETGWHRYDVVFTANMHKFAQTPDLRRALVAKGQPHLAEASPHDLIWGIGYNADNPLAQTEPAGPNMDRYSPKPCLQPPQRISPLAANHRSFRPSPSQHPPLPTRSHLPITSSTRTANLPSRLPHKIPHLTFVCSHLSLTPFP